MRTLTKRQKVVLEYIKDFIRMHDHAPSYEEIAGGLGLSSPSTIHVHVENLRLKGHLTKKWNANRSIDLPVSGDPRIGAVDVPLVGRIAAGLPIQAVEVPESIAIPADLLGRNQTFVLRVSGDSMRDDHVLDGDFVIVDKRDIARNGDMVVALIRGSEATLKRYYRDGRLIRLEPANPTFPAQMYDEQEVTVQGVVVGILRKYGR